jgi:hypothetical protein
MAFFHVARHGLATLSVAIWAGIVPAVAEGIRDWPCPQTLTERFAPEAVWGGPLPAEVPKGWRDDGAVRAVVELAANPENPPSHGAREIAAFAGELGADRQDRLMLVFAGLLDKFDTLRGFLIEGVRDFVLRAKILREAIDRHDAALAALPADAGGEVEDQRRGYQEARFWDARQMDDALEEAEFLCRRYAYLDRKLGQLTAAIRSAW